MKNLLIIILILGLFGCGSKQEEVKKNKQSIVFFNDYPPFEELLIDEIDTIIYNDAEKKFGSVIFKEVEFKFRFFQLMLLSNKTNGPIDTIEKKTYPTATLHFLQENYANSDSVTARREIALVDTMKVPHEGAHFYLLWLASLRKADFSSKEAENWDETTKWLYDKLKANIKPASNPTVN